MRPGPWFGILPALVAGSLTLTAPLACAQSKAAQPADKTEAAEVMDDRDAQYSLRELMGVEVMSPQGETLGELYDVIYSRADEKLTAIISVGGVLGVGEKLVAEPFSAIDISGEDRVIMNATPEDLERRPGFDYAALDKPFAPEPGAQDAFRAEYLKEWTTRMNRWSERVDAHASEIAETARVHVDEAWRETQARWAELKQTTEENWDRASASFESAFAAFKESWKTSGGPD